MNKINQNISFFNFQLGLLLIGRLHRRSHELMSTATFNVCASTLIKHLIIANMILKAKNMQLLALFESSEVHVN